MLRWEYMRGSTLFVVWDMSQADYARPGQFSLFRDLRGTFGGERDERADGEGELLVQQLSI